MGQGQFGAEKAGQEGDPKRLSYRFQGRAAGLNQGSKQGPESEQLAVNNWIITGGKKKEIAKQHLC